ncbi:DUF3617 domain-containing protein [Alkalimonas collagenimarina]|uniref:DUF3617 domain-containing protein n=1 Tax=Alkalimonas collagenimarina TaxID=400390 RepID=A0ABT9GZB9_9GAMM|nr:DUF3617 domain-containing protein [Alkalimonas collagenimarina]MDP4536035.1 DUF3617 domain-containing protein [Alkalimonas collagenimarina]
MKYLNYAVVITVFFLSNPVLADAPKLNMQPGLWQHNISMQSESGELERAMEEARKQLEGLPAAQRRMMESMLEQQGISFGGTSSSIQVCLTEEEINRGMMPQQDGCSQTLEPQGDDRFTFSFECQGNPPTSGSGEMVFESPRSYRGNANFTTEINGRAERMTMQQQGTWLDSDCGRHQ